jgi:F-type H+-transporting ATPase subunit a
MGPDDLAMAPVFRIGPLAVTGTVVTTWALIVATGLLCWGSTRRLRIQPGRLQTAVEGVVGLIEVAVRDVAGPHTQAIVPFVGSLWIFLVTANLVGLIPGLHSPTRDLSATAALAFLVFLSTHWYGIRAEGLGGYLRHYLSPSPILLPFHLVSEITRTIALAVRLFGNMMSLEMAALLILLVAGFLAPIPILMLHIIEALVQAYIFGMLALIYICGGIQAQQIKRQKKESSHA